MEKICVPDTAFLQNAVVLTYNWKWLLLGSQKHRKAFRAYERKKFSLLYSIVKPRLRLLGLLLLWLSHVIHRLWTRPLKRSIFTFLLSFPVRPHGTFTKYGRLSRGPGFNYIETPLTKTCWVILILVKTLKRDNATFKRTRTVSKTFWTFCCSSHTWSGMNSSFRGLMLAHVTELMSQVADFMLCSCYTTFRHLIERTWRHLWSNWLKRIMGNEESG